VAIVHPASGSSETVDLWRLLRHGDVRQDPVLSAGDVVLVERAKSRISDEEFRQLSRSNLYAEEFPVVVMGEVQKPGKIMLTADSPSLDAAIAQALGFNGNANRHKVLIARPNGQGGFSKLYANPNKADLALLPNDVVYVMRSRVDLAKDEIQNLTERIRDLGTGTFSLWRSFDPVRFGVGF
jgi:polysaccharide export outer membrane protein